MHSLYVLHLIGGPEKLGILRDRACAFFFLFTLLAFVFTFGAETVPLHGLNLRVETSNGLTRLWADVERAGGVLNSSLLHETTKKISQELTGTDPAKRACFASWTESNGVRWFSYSREAGRKWSPAKPLKTDLRLRDGSIEPQQSMPSVPSDLALSSGGRLFLVQFQTISL